MPTMLVTSARIASHDRHATSQEVAFARTLDEVLSSDILRQPNGLQSVDARETAKQQRQTDVISRIAVVVVVLCGKRSFEITWPAIPVFGLEQPTR